MIPASVTELSKADSLEGQLKREQEKLSALQDVGVALGSSLDLDEVLSMVLARISRVIDADRATLYLLDEDTGELSSKLVSGDEVKEIRLAPGRGLAGWVAQHGEAVRINDVYRDARFDSEWDALTGYRTVSTLCVPMKNHVGRTLGVVQALNKRTGGFDEADEHLLLALASQAAVSIENSKLFLSLVGKNMELLDTKDQLERRVEELDVLFEIAKLSASSTRLDELLEVTLEHAMRAIQAEASAALMVSDGGEGSLRFISTYASKTVRRVSLHGDDGAHYLTHAPDEPQIVNQLDEAAVEGGEPLAARFGYEMTSRVSIPLRWEGGRGQLDLYNKRAGAEFFSPDDLRLASTIGSQACAAIGMVCARERRKEQDRLSTIGQLLSGVLHDVKTPMAVVSGYIQMMMEEPSQALRQQYGQKILQQIEFINSMSKETLAFAKGDRSTWIRKVYLSSFIDDASRHLMRVLEGRNVELRVEMSDRGIAHFDQHKVLRAVQNLARNAWEALSPAGGVITLSVDRRDDGGVAISVTDNGPGIPGEIRDKLFESFTTHGKADGTGLGLAIVKKIADDHRGQVEVSSQPGRTRFTLVVPDLREDSAVSPERESMEAKPRTFSSPKRSSNGRRTLKMRKPRMLVQPEKVSRD